MFLYLFFAVPVLTIELDEDILGVIEDDALEAAWRSAMLFKQGASALLTRNDRDRIVRMRGNRFDDEKEAIAAHRPACLLSYAVRTDRQLRKSRAMNQPRAAANQQRANRRTSVTQVCVELSKQTILEQFFGHHYFNA